MTSIGTSQERISKEPTSKWKDVYRWGYCVSLRSSFRTKALIPLASGSVALSYVPLSVFPLAINNFLPKVIPLPRDNQHPVIGQCGCDKLPGPFPLGKSALQGYASPRAVHGMSRSLWMGCQFCSLHSPTGHSLINFLHINLHLSLFIKEPDLR